MIYNNNIKNTNTGALFGLNTQGYVLDHNISTHTYISIQTLAVGYHLGESAVGASLWIPV